MDDNEGMLNNETLGQEPEKSLPQSQVNAIVQREKASVADKVRRELEAKHKEEIDAIKTSQTQGMGGMQGVDEDAIKQRVIADIMQQVEAEREEASKAQHKEAMENVAEQFFGKMKAGSEKYQDFEKVMDGLDIAKFPQLVFMLSGVENADEVMYELAKNPHKLATIDYFSQRDPTLAKNELKKLSDSIVENRRAVDENVKTEPPLSRLKSSIVGADTGKMTLKDLKNKYRG